MQSANRALVARLQVLEGPGLPVPEIGDRVMEFHVSRQAREALGIEGSLFRSTGNLILPDFRTARELARRINERVDAALLPERAVRAGRLNAMALIDEILHIVARLFREKAFRDAPAKALAALEASLGSGRLDRLLLAFVDRFPPQPVYEGKESPEVWLAGSSASAGMRPVPNRELALEELILLRLANENPAFAPFRFLFDESILAVPGSPEAAAYETAVSVLGAAFADMPRFGPDDQDLLTMLRSPAAAAPYSLPDQLDYIRRRWGLLLGDLLLRLLGSLDLIREEEKPRFPGPGPTRAYAYSGMEREYERFSPDADWMPNVVMIAKSTLVWLWQLSRAYGRDIRTLDAIPDEELDALASRGFNALWLIGLWERSQASAEIKRRCGNPEAAPSAYSLFDYEIAGELGGWPALEELRRRCSWRGIRLAADMVPNHTGMDSTWVRERPELFIQSDQCPFPGYSFNGGDLSGDAKVGLWLEDHYYDRTDAAVVFKRLDRGSGRVSYIYHGNDGTGLPWSDTAQIDFLRSDAREAVKERILHVARNFPIIRFDAAMIMAKKHFRRLWYPEPGQGGDIASRSGRAVSREDFDRAMPEEFWREVVDMCAREAPDTLLLAEAFWMMEGYFVRTLGMHRVYNSAFMNMLKHEENAKYRETIRNTQEFDKDILKRFVNFMNNPDEETAVAQFGKGDKYFGACTMMATMPGLPMFGHGQLEGFEEKYGMEYRRAYRDEAPDRALMERHEREIFPLLKRRRLFSGVERFLLYDLVGPDGSVNENVFAYSNGDGVERALVIYNNAYARAEGRIRESAPYAEKLAGGGKRPARSSLAAALGLRDAGRASSGRERFCVMREQRSELWFIRRSRELAEGGLAVFLDGYQSQIFLDFFELEDDERGLYADVCDTLAGAGAPDFSAAVQDVALRELYALLASLVTPELLAWAEGLFEPLRERSRGGAPRTSAKAAAKEAPAASRNAALKASAEPAAALYAKLRSLMRESAAEEGLRGDASPRGAAEKGGGAAKRDEAAVKAAAKRFASSLETLAGFASLGRAPAPQARPEAARLVEAELALPGAPSLALCYAVMDGIKCLCAGGGTAAAARIDEDASEGARRIVDRYCLDRKLREALRARGMHGDEAFRSVGLAKALLPRLGNEGSGALDPASFLEGCAQDEEMRSLLGFNVYGGVTWFNKERFEEAVRRAALYAALARSDLDSARIAAALVEAAQAVGYSYDALSAALGPSAKAAAKTKPQTASKPAAKAEAKAAPAKAAAKPKSANAKPKAATVKAAAKPAAKPKAKPASKAEAKAKPKTATKKASAKKKGSR
jgi:glycosidase